MMIVVMAANAKLEEIRSVVEKVEKAGLKAHLSQGEERTIIGIIGNREVILSLAFENMPGVDGMVAISHPFKLVSRDFREEDTVIRVGNAVFGGDQVSIIAGPCAVESEKQIIETALWVKEKGGSVLRGGAFKPRTSPYSFCGLEEQGLRYLAKAREETGLPIVTEVMDARHVELVAAYADILQIGARNMQNFFLLREVAKINKPVLLKRGPSATIEEWLMAAEYIVSGGNSQVILCERGIKTFENYTRNTLDLSAVPAVKRLSHLPVIIDPSHGTGRWRMVLPMAKGAVAVGANGLMVEVHPNPGEALSDGPQSLNFSNFALLMDEIRSIVTTMGKVM
jgi:3-deoxy-7-phosphoheptulonate synthase